MAAKIYVGCSGWYYKEWKNLFYPGDLPLKDYFRYYTGFFNSVEINNTFYRLPTKKAVQTWYAQAPKGFKYSLKASRYITHIKRFRDVKEPLRRLYGLNDILGEKMGCFLFQFPESLSFTPETLERLITQLDSNYKNIVEFRHKGWWNSHVIQAFQSSNIGFCTVSGWGLPEDLMIINKGVYLRFHGNPLYSSLYSEQTLSQWAQKLKSHSLTEIWIYFNNDQNAYAVRNALQLKNLLA